MVILLIETIYHHPSQMLMDIFSAIDAIASFLYAATDCLFVIGEDVCLHFYVADVVNGQAAVDAIIGDFNECAE